MKRIMMEKTNIKAQNDSAVLQILGEYIKQNRLEQNKTQMQLATEAGLDRTTLSEFEQGKRSNTLTFIRLLRALDLLEVLQTFIIQEKISPLKLAELEQKKRKRASGKKQSNKRKFPDW